MSYAPNTSDLPYPGYTALGEEYFQRAFQGELVVPRCGACGYHRWPPAYACYHCGSTDWDWDALPGTGRVFSYTWGDMRADESWPLFNISVIELDGTTGEPVRLMSQVRDVDKDSLVIDLPVTVQFEDFDDTMKVPTFRPS